MQGSAAIFTLSLSEHPTCRLRPRLVEGLRELAPGIVLRIRSFTGRDEAVTLLERV